MSVITLPNSTTSGKSGMPVACWAHNPKVPGSKPGSAMHVLSQAWPVLCATQSFLKLAPFLQSFLKGGTAPPQAKSSAKS